LWNLALDSSMEAQESSGSVSIHIDGGIGSEWALFSHQISPVLWPGRHRTMCCRRHRTMCYSTLARVCCVESSSRYRIDPVLSSKRLERYFGHWFGSGHQTMHFCTACTIVTAPSFESSHWTGTGLIRCLVQTCTKSFDRWPWFLCSEVPMASSAC
jgi:hypothetical protein